MDPIALEDLSDLEFDVERHREALPAFAKLNLNPQSIRPTLRARDYVLVRVPSCNFTIRSSASIETGRGEIEAGCCALESIFQDGNPEETEQVRTDVERYFLRHFPGRTIKAPAADFSRLKGSGNVVFVACYAAR